MEQLNCKAQLTQEQRLSVFRDMQGRSKLEETALASVKKLTGLRKRLANTLAFHIGIATACDVNGPTDFSRGRSCGIRDLVADITKDLYQSRDED